MEPEAFNWIDLLVKLLAASGAAAWISSILTNKRGSNRALDAILDFVELVAGNIGKSKNDPNV